MNLFNWFRKLCTFYKIKTTGVPEYLFDLIPETNHINNTCSSDIVTTFYSRADVYKYSFFPYTILEWKKLDKYIQQFQTIMSFRNCLWRIGWPTPICPCSLEVASSSHFFLLCHYHLDIWKTPFNELQSVDENIFKSL